MLPFVSHLCRALTPHVLLTGLLILLSPLLYVVAVRFLLRMYMLHEHNFVFLLGNMVYHLSVVFVYFLGLDQDVA